jgi:hypothetical protein
MFTIIIIFNYNSEQLGTPAFRENYLYLVVQCRVEFDTLNYSILFLVFPQLLPYNQCL